jgi:hypothetical protein
MDITFNCDFCGQGIEIDRAGAGVAVRCPKCYEKIVVPKQSTQIAGNTKKCPFCFEVIHVNAIKCKHCGEFLTRKSRAPAPIQQSAPQVPPDDSSLITCAYLFAVIFPIIGIVLGIVLLCRGKTDHGVQAILLSVVSSMILWVVLTNL